jgi:hypothetical protein
MAILDKSIHLVGNVIIDKCEVITRPGNNPEHIFNIYTPISMNFHTEIHANRGIFVSTRPELVAGWFT